MLQTGEMYLENNTRPHDSCFSALVLWPDSCLMALSPPGGKERDPGPSLNKSEHNRVSTPWWFKKMIKQSMDLSRGTTKRRKTQYSFFLAVMALIQSQGDKNSGVQRRRECKRKRSRGVTVGPPQLR